MREIRSRHKYCVLLAANSEPISQKFLHKYVKGWLKISSAILFWKIPVWPKMISSSHSVRKETKTNSSHPVKQYISIFNPRPSPHPHFDREYACRKQATRAVHVPSILPVFCIPHALLFSLRSVFIRCNQECRSHFHFNHSWNNGSNTSTDDMHPQCLQCKLFT